MYAPSELELGYLLIVGGVILLLSPTFIRMLDNYAPDASMKMGEGLGHESVEIRRRQRLPLKKRLSTLPNRGLIGGAVILLLLVLMFLLISPQESRGIYIRLTPLRGREPDEDCLAGPIVVTVNQHHASSQMLLNGTEVSREELQRALRTKLSTRANWEVFVEGDDSVPYADPIYVIDVINALHAKALILTPKLKRELADRCAPRYSAY